MEFRKSIQEVLYLMLSIYRGESDLIRFDSATNV